MSHESVWSRPTRGRGEEPALGREQIVAAAIALLDSDGLAGFTMRSLGARLGAGTTSVYWYVRTKDDVFDLVLDEVLGEVPLPPADGDRWRELAAAMARDTRAMVIRHPWVTSLFGKSPSAGPNAARLSDASLGLFFAGGFSGNAAAYGATGLSALALGTAIGDAAWQQMLAASSLSPDELFTAIESQLDERVDELPNYRRWRSEVGTPNMATMRDDGFEFGLQRLLDGLAAYLDG